MRYWDIRPDILVLSGINSIPRHLRGAGGFLFAGYITAAAEGTLMVEDLHKAVQGK